MRLDELGFPWEPLTIEGRVAIGCLWRFGACEGHSRVPNSTNQRTDTAWKLGPKRRRVKVGNELSADRKRKLDDFDLFGTRTVRPGIKAIGIQDFSANKAFQVPRGYKSRRI
jgi:hypothetical protein